MFRRKIWIKNFVKFQTVQSFHPPNLTFYLLAYRLMQLFQHMKDKNWEDMLAMSLLNKRKILLSNRNLWDNEKTMHHRVGYEFVIKVSPLAANLRQRRSNKEESCSPNNFTRASLSVKFNTPICNDSNWKCKLANNCRKYPEVKLSAVDKQVRRSEIRESACCSNFLHAYYEAYIMVSRDKYTLKGLWMLKEIFHLIPLFHCVFCCGYSTFQSL